MVELGVRDVDSREKRKRLDRDSFALLLLAFWVEMVGQSVFGRQILRVPFVLLLLFCTVARPGAILSTSVYKYVGIQYRVRMQQGDLTSGRVLTSQDIHLYVDRRRIPLQETNTPQRMPADRCRSPAKRL
jgi:hypothetical protein